MKKSILLALFAIFALSACASKQESPDGFYRLPAKESALPRDSFFVDDDKFFPPPAKAVTALASANAIAIAAGKLKKLPGGMTVIGVAAGDLNGDGRPDLAVALQRTVPLPAGGGDKRDDDGVRRYLLVFSGDSKGGYTLEHASANMILGPHDGGVLGDPFAGIAITDGKLVIKHYGGSSDRWGFETSFAYVDGRFRLVELHNSNTSTHSYGGEETTCDFIRYSVTKRPLYGGPADIPTDEPLYAGELDRTIYLFDDAVFTRFASHASLPFLPSLGYYQFDRFSAPLPLRMSPERVLDDIKTAYHPNLTKIGMPWTAKMRAAHSRLLFYEAPDYFYRGPEGALSYARLEANDTGDGAPNTITHVLDFSATGDGKSVGYEVDDATGTIKKW